MPAYWYRLPAVAAACLSITVLLNPGSPAQSPEPTPAVLQGHLKQTVYELPVSHGPTGSGLGQVVQANGGQPLGGVTVRIPALGWQTASDAQGRFQLPPLTRQPVIAVFEKPGYRPLSATLDSGDTDALANAPFQARLEKLGQAVLIDTELHHLGDGSYSPVSAGAAKFRQQSTGPVLRRTFQLHQVSSGPAWIEIGSIIGLDTRQAHAAGQSNFHRASTNLRVLLNGRLIGEIGINGDRQRIPVPPSLLRPGTNTLTVQTGYQSPDGTYVDFDDVELILLSLIF